MDNKIIKFESENGTTIFDVNISEETVWLSQNQMAELFKKEEQL